MEQDQKFKEAALNYEQAWKYGNKSNPNIGNDSISILQCVVKALEQHWGNVSLVSQYESSFMSKNSL